MRTVSPESGNVGRAGFVRTWASPADLLGVNSKGGPLISG